uniref:tRNA (cytosine(34)-C(5))-methyltransferase n=1 Tax=Culex tarsalis TaxID=7177 RepID=A0A1Q3EZJ6_CULTA
MGKKRHFTNKQNPFAKRKRDQKEKGQTEPVRRDKPYEDIIRKNESFEAYYKHLNICKPEEWDEFMRKVRSNQPATFRITGLKNPAHKRLKIIKDQFFTEYRQAVAALPGASGKDIVSEPKCLAWHPNEFAWQLELSPKEIQSLEPLFKNHNFINLQEDVSIVSTLVLSVEPHHKVLDMNAKTAHLIEALHAAGGDALPTGFVMANAIDNKRCSTLVNQAKRLASASGVVVNTDSVKFPSLVVENRAGELVPLKYDRILCDVPCSGDGTIRNNPEMWISWNAGHANGLHGLQYRTVKRAVELLEVGGKLVYSTSSLNPIENEAVLHHLLAETGDALEIVEASQLVPNLKHSPGMTYWEPAFRAGRTMRFYQSFDEVPEKLRSLIRPPMFAPAPEEAAKFNLDRCIRVLPHHQNTGGFFIALLEKKRRLPWEDKQLENATGRFRREFEFFDGNEEIFESIKHFYQINDTFNKLNLMTRSCEGNKNNIYFSAEIIRNIVSNNENKIKFINLGVKTFARCDNMVCDFRLAQEGLESINGFIGARRRARIVKEDLIKLLSNNDPTKPPEIDGLSEETQANVKELEPGSCVLEYRGDDGLDLDLVGWRGTKSLRAYVDQHDTVHMLRLLGADVSKYEKNKFEENRAAEAEAEAEAEADIQAETEIKAEDEAEQTAS